MANQKIDVIVNISDMNKAQEEMTRVLIDLIKARVSNYPQPCQSLLCNMLINKIKSIM